MDETTATQETGVEFQQETQGNDDASLLSAFLAQEDSSHDGVDAASTDNEEVGQDVEPAPTNDVFNVKINGTEKQVTRDELIAHYQKGEASTQKFEEAANLRREYEQKHAATIQERQLLQNALNKFTQDMAGNQPDWQDLLNNNPHEYLRQKELFAEKQYKAQAAQAYLNQQYEAQQQQHIQFENQRLQNEHQRLATVIPEWADSAKRSAESQELVKFLSGKGYEQARIDALSNTDAETIKLAVSAMRYEKLVAQSKQATKQVKNLPPRVERPGVSGNTDRSGFAEAKQRLGRSGSIADATDAFAAMFGN